MGCDLRQYSAAARLLRELFGQDWIDRRIPLRPGGTFMHPGGPRAGDPCKHQDRVVALAEMLFNLLHVEGIEQRIEGLREADIESALGELEGARLLYVTAIPFRFVRPSGTKGRDFDVEAVVGAHTVACEMKAKVEGTSPSAEGVSNSIDRARGQVPAGQGSVVFLRVPETWLGDPSGRAAIKEGIRTSLSRTTRIALVVVHWEEWATLTLQGSAARMVRGTLFRGFSNPRARAPLLGLADAVEAWPQARGSNWVDFGEALCTPDEVAVMRGSHRAMGALAALRAGALVPRGGVTYAGSVLALRERAPEAVRTLIDFDCDHLETRVLLPAGMSLHFTLASGPARDVILSRRAASPAFQLAVPFAVIDEELIETDGCVRPSPDRIRRQRDRLRAGSPEDLDEEDGLIGFLRQLFRAMRGDGDMLQARCLLSDLVVWHQDKESKETLFEARYLGRSIAV
jgi:hypothetical protein